jgi:surface antigen
MVIVFMVVSGLLIGSAQASAGVDDYPSQWRTAAQDALVDSWGYYNRECTSFVAWRLHSRNNFEMPHAIGNAGTWGGWFGARGYAVNNSPAVGSIAESSGHVAWVESVHPDSTVTIEEYNASYNGVYSERRVSASSFHYIHAKDLAPGGAGYNVAIQANTGSLVTVGTAGGVNWQQGMASGTSPSVAALAGGGYEVAFQTNTGGLVTVGSAGSVNWQQGLASGTSPSIAALPGGGYQVAFQTNTGGLVTMGTAGSTNWQQGMAVGTNPAIA